MRSIISKIIKGILIGLILQVVFSGYALCNDAKLPIGYLDRITTDEEDMRIRYPSFVFSEPVKNEIYVIDSMGRIIIYTSDLFPIITLDKRNDIDAPQGLAVDPAGYVYVVQGQSREHPRCRISVYNPCLIWQRDIYVEGFKDCDKFMPYRIASDRHGRLYIAGISYPGVIVTDNTGKYIETISPEENGKMAKIIHVALDNEGRIYLVSEEESRIYVYDEDRKFLFKFGEKGGGSGKLSRPVSLAVDNRNGMIYIDDYMRHTISVYDKTGKYLYEFGGLGWGEGWFQHPRDIAVDSSGRVLVADTFNDRIEVFQPKEEQRANSK